MQDRRYEPYDPDEFDALYAELSQDDVRVPKTGPLAATDWSRVYTPSPPEPHPAAEWLRLILGLLFFGSLYWLFAEAQSRIWDDPSPASRTTQVDDNNDEYDRPQSCGLQGAFDC